MQTDFINLCIPTLVMLIGTPNYSYADFNSKRNLSAIIAINSLFVGFPLLAEIVYQKIFSTIFWSPLPQATSIAWRILTKQTFQILSKGAKAINSFVPINIYWFYSKMFIGMILRDFLRNLNRKFIKTFVLLF